MSHSAWNDYQQHAGFPPPAHGAAGMGGGVPYSNPSNREFYAGWWSRAGALVVDGAIFALPNGILSASGVIVELNGGSAWIGIALIVLSIVVLIATFIWQVRQEGRSGQTVGKRLFGLRLVRASSFQPLGVGTALIRRICHFIDSFVFYLGWLLPIWDAKRQTIADKIVGSVVIKV